MEIPDDHDWGTGRWTMNFLPSSVTATTAIFSVMFNPPTFFITAAIYVNREIMVNLGEVDGSTGKDHRVFLLPRNLDPEPAHSLVIQFKHWRLVQANLDDVYLATKPPNSN
jgi:hypothetical protein